MWRTTVELSELAVIPPRRREVSGVYAITFDCEYGAQLRGRQRALEAARRATADAVIEVVT